MGYCVSYSIFGVRIPQNKVESCLAAINALGDKDWSWVHNPPAGGFKTLKHAFDAWRFEAVLQSDGSFDLEYFNGEKLGDEETLFGAIAPFVEPEGIIEALGEEGERWRFLFDGESLISQQAHIEWR